MSRIVLCGRDVRALAGRADVGPDVVGGLAGSDPGRAFRIGRLRRTVVSWWRTRELYLNPREAVLVLPLGRAWAASLFGVNGGHTAPRLAGIVPDRTLIDKHCRYVRCRRRS